MAEVRGDPERIDVRWLGEGLERSGAARGAALVQAEFAEYVGTGQTGSNARIALTWDDPAGRPRTVVGKYPSRDPFARAGAFERGTYYNEFDFYTNLAPTLAVRTPRCHLAHYSHDPYDFVLIMEDLADSRQGDQFVGLTPDEAAAALVQAVAIHAPRWGDPTLDLFAPQRPRGTEAAEALGGTYALMVEPFLDRLGAGLDDDVVELVRGLGPLAVRWAMGTDTPKTVVHNDFRPDNLMFGLTADAPPVVVVDWQTVRQGNAMFDIAYLIGGGFEPSLRASVEAELLADYRSRLTASGVEYSSAVLQRDYRHASLWGVVMTVIATILAAQTERGDRMLTVMGQRHGRHALELDALGVLRDP